MKHNEYVQQVIRINDAKKGKSAYPVIWEQNTKSRIGNKDLYAFYATIDPYEAWRILTEEKFEGQRIVNANADLYADLMKDTLFRRGTEITFAEWQGRHYCVNGQHTLHAITRCGVAQDVLVHVHRVRREIEIGELFGTFDRYIRRTNMQAHNAMKLPAFHHF